MPATSLVTTLQDIARIAKERGRVYDPRRHHVWCSYCSAPLGAWGIIHLPDCNAAEGEILFRELD